MTDMPTLDQDALRLPDGWLGEVEPRRGGLAVPAPEVDAGAVAEVRALLAERRELVEGMLDAGYCDRELAGAVRAFLAGHDTVTGAAAVAMITRLGGRPDHFPRVAHAWAAEHGLVWTAAVFVAGNEIVCKPRVWGRAAEGVPLAERFAVRYATAADGSKEWSQWPSAGPVLRGWLAAADEETYRLAEGRLAALRTGMRSRLGAAYLLPARTDWVEESCRDLGTGPYDREPRRMLLSSLGTVEQTRLVGWDGLGSRRDIPLLATLLDGVGPGIAPVLARALDEDPHGRRGRSSTGARRELLEALARIPTDEALGLLLDRSGEPHVLPAVRAALDRFPARGLRVLAARGEGGSRRAATAAGLLGAFAAAGPERTRAALDRLPPPARAAVEAAIAADACVAEATGELLPRILVAPPWAGDSHAKAEPYVLADPPAPPDPEMHWTGEDLARVKEFQREFSPLYPEGVPVDWKRAVQEVDPDAGYRGPDGMPRGGHLLMASLLLQGPTEVAGALLARWADSGDAGHPVLYQPLIAHRYGLAALPHLLRRHEKKVRGEGKELLLPFLSADVARLMAFWLARRASCRPIAERWFARYGIRAAVLLLPDALGKRGRRRGDAEHALAHLADAVGSAEIVQAARELGDGAADAIAGLLAETAARPPEMPAVGAWADPADLPRVLLRDRAHALPPGAVRHLLIMLAASSPEDPHPGLAEVRQACDAASLAEFSMTVFDRWLRHGSPGKDLWALTQLTAFDGDGAARTLAPIVARWPRTGAPRWASTALRVLAAIGTDRALLTLDGVTRQTRSPALRDQADRMIQDVARRQGLSADQLADRLVPDLGLDASGTLTLDYGRRWFTIGLDERLRPVVTGQDGERRTSLPRPGARDDAELAPAAYRRFRELREDVQAIAAEQVRRLERAMLVRRSWGLAGFRTLLVEHPLMSHLARRLLWLSLEDGRHTLFRIAEDRGFADVDDETFVPSGDARVFLPHPADLSTNVGAEWGQVFADYELLQPFPQVGREVHRFTGDEHATGRLTRFEGRTVATGAVLGLARRDWRSAPPRDRLVRAFSRPLGSCDLVIELDPGIATGAVQIFPEQTLRRVYLTDGSEDPGGDPIDNQAFDAADPVLVSEALTDLLALAR